jgi:NADH-quinone oxidoreductase subunit M
MGGFARAMPGIATFFLIGALTSLGLPGLSGFVAEILVFLGAWESSYAWWLVPAVLGAFITAVYVLRVSKWIFFGPAKEIAPLTDAVGFEWIAPTVLSGVLILLGIYPKLLLDPINKSIIEFLDIFAK